MKILIAEDDQYIREGLQTLLQGEGYHVILAANGEEAVSFFTTENPDFIILDIMMPEKDGYSVCREIRQSNKTVPVIFLSAKSEEIDRVVGLELGADDFISKPFGTREVIARIRTITRRCLNQNQTFSNESFQLDDITVVPAELRALRGNGEKVELSLRDVKILYLLFKNQGKVVDRDTISNECWGHNYFPSSRTLDQHISKLRKRIENNPQQPRIIKTVHGVGYRFDS